MRASPLRAIGALVAVATAISGPSWPPAALAHDHEPPGVVLVVSGERQHGLAYYTSWSARHGRYCKQWIAEGPRRSPDAMPSPVDARARIRLHDDNRPRRIAVTAWRAVGPHDDAVGPGTPIPDRVVRRTDGRRTGYDILLELDVVGDLYVEAVAVWRDRENCDGRQERAWTFHLSSTALSAVRFDPR